MDDEFIDLLVAAQPKDQATFVAGLITVAGRKMTHPGSPVGSDGNRGADGVARTDSAAKPNHQEFSGVSRLSCHQGRRGIHMRDNEVLQTVAIPVDSR